MAKINPHPYEWDYSGNCAPGGPQYFSSSTFSVGIFQWVPKSSGKGLKKAAVTQRIKGSYSNPDEVYDKAKRKCSELNAQRIGYPKEE